MNFAEWGVSIAFDFFFGSIAIGTFIFSILIKKINGSDNKITQIAAYLSPISLLVAMVFLITHLGKPLNSIWILLQFNFTSVIAWGSLLQGIFLIISICYALMVFADSEEIKTINDESSKVLKILAAVAGKFSNVSIKEKLGYIGLPVAALIGIYHGFLLMSFDARPLWNTGIVSVISITSFVSSGIAAIVLFVKIKYKDSEFSFIELVRNILFAALTIQAVMIFFWIASLIYGNIAEHNAVITLIIKHYFSFWLFAIVCGTIIPIVIYYKDIIKTRKTGELSFTAPVITTALILFGSFFLRYAMIAAAQ